eukprot:jgi/Mesvir1/25668/Mv01882-RA.1
MVAVISSHTSRLRDFLATARIPWREILLTSMRAPSDDMPRTEDEYYEILGLVEEIVHGNVVLRLDKARSARAAAETPSLAPPEKPDQDEEKIAGNAAAEAASSSKVEVVVGSGRLWWWESAVAEIAEEHISPYKDVLEGWEQPGSSYAQYLHRNQPPATHELSPDQRGAFPPRHRADESQQQGGSSSSVRIGPLGTIPRVRVYPPPQQAPGFQDGSFAAEVATSPVAAHASRRMAALDESYTNLLQRTGLPVSPLSAPGPSANLFQAGASQAGVSFRSPEKALFRSPEKATGGGWAHPTSPTAAGMSLGDVSTVRLQGMGRGEVTGRASQPGGLGYAWEALGGPHGGNAVHLGGQGKARMNDTGAAAPLGFDRMDDGVSRGGYNPGYPDRSGYYRRGGNESMRSDQGMGGNSNNRSNMTTGAHGATMPGPSQGGMGMGGSGAGAGNSSMAGGSFSGGYANASANMSAAGGGYGGSAGEQPLSPTALLRSAQQMHEQLRPRAVQRTPAARALKDGAVGEDRDRLRFSYNMMRLSHGALEGYLTRMIGQLEAERGLFAGPRVFVD